MQIRCMPNLIEIRLTDRKSYVMGFEPPVVNAVGCHEKLDGSLKPNIVYSMRVDLGPLGGVKRKPKKLSGNELTQARVSFEWVDSGLVGTSALSASHFKCGQRKRSCGSVSLVVMSLNTILRLYDNNSLS
jgi:hypothetical protein